MQFKFKTLKNSSLFFLELIYIQPFLSLTRRLNLPVDTFLLRRVVTMEIKIEFLYNSS